MAEHLLPLPFIQLAGIECGRVVADPAGSPKELVCVLRRGFGMVLFYPLFQHSGYCFSLTSPCTLVQFIHKKYERIA